MGCLKHDAGRTDCTTNLASVLVDIGGQEALAEQLYRRVLELDPTQIDAAYNLALLLQDRRDDDATREAARLYEGVVSADETRWDAWANLATALSELKETPIRTIKAFEQAILILEGHEAAQKQSSSDGGFDRYLARLYYGYGMALAELTSELCATLARQPHSLLIGSDVGGRATGELCVENAANALRTALQLNPNDVQAEHMLASLLADQAEEQSGGHDGGVGGGGIGGGADAGGGGSARGGKAGLSRASPAFVQTLFDDFADTFDNKLASLQYVVPRLLGETARSLAIERGHLFASALDAGCGTGLAGQHLRPVVAGALVGVDLSEKMLLRAAALRVGQNAPGEAAVAASADLHPPGRPVYDKLIASDLLTLERAQLLDGALAGFELITAADVLVYFGELTELLASFSELSTRDGLLVFTCERVDERAAPRGWKLNPSGRFAHSKQYVENSAKLAHWNLIAYREIVPRYEGSTPVEAHLFVFKHE